MKRKTLRTLAVPIAVMLSLGLTISACGGSDDDGSAKGDDSGQSTAGGGGGGGGDGKELYSATCASCHGPDAKGLEGLGKDLTDSEFAIGLSDDDLVAFIKKGRSASDPDNTTGVDMPAKGGNPALKDDDMHAIVTYLRTLEP